MNGLRPCGTMFFQCFTKPCAIEPATMIAPKVMVARAAVTLKFAVAVVPPWSTCLRNECSPVRST